MESWSVGVKEYWKDLKADDLLQVIFPPLHYSTTPIRQAAMEA